MNDITVNNFKPFYEQIRPYLGAVHSGFTPIGTVISVMGTTAPLNYLACDGTVYNIADYTELAAYFNQQFGSSNFFGGNGTTTFAVPDLRGEFLRGTGTNSHANQGSGAAVGVHQDATEHLYMFKYTNNNVYFGGRNEYIEPSNTDTVTTDTSGRSDVSTSSTTTTEPKTYTSRPTNTSVLYCIAAKNIFMDAGSNYSTEEQVVGTWIDGKPIYQKTVVIDPLVYSTVQTEYEIANVSNLHIGDIIENFALLWNSARTYIYSLPNGDGANSRVQYKHSESKLLFISEDTWGNAKLISTIRYTKTTD